jgi:hypothetical protein
MCAAEILGKGGAMMYRKMAFFVAILSIVALAGSALAAPSFTVKQIIVYDGYLQQDVDSPEPGQTLLVADTLFVVNNGNKKATTQVNVWIEVFDKHGNLINEGTLYNGGDLLTDNKIPANGFGWITLGMMVPRDTVDPWGFPAGEKFVVKISTGKGDPGVCKANPVEVKQVIYDGGGTTVLAGEAIWRADLIKAWAETCLGGQNGPGVTKHPGNYGN